MPLPDGYSITTTMGLKVLWQDGHCVTVASAGAADDLLATIAARHHVHVTSVAEQHQVASASRDRPFGANGLDSSVTHTHVGVRSPNGGPYV